MSMGHPLVRQDDQQNYQEAMEAYYNAVCAYFDAPSVVLKNASPQERQRWIEQQTHMDTLKANVEGLLP